MREASETRRLDEHLIKLGRLASSLSHEIRNPLATVFLLVDFLEEELHHPSADGQAQTAQSLADLKVELNRIHELVENYLSLARLADLRREPEDLDTIVHTCALEFQQRCAERGITLHMEGLEDLKQVPLHRNTFYRVLVNLVQNAIDAMPQGGTLTFRGWQAGTQVHLVVQDSGSGIPEDELPQVFEPFHTTKSDGTGLGMYVVQEILAAHGGSITLRSSCGIGTTCTLTLPLLTTEVMVPHGA